MTSVGIESFVDRLGGVSIDRVDLTDADLSGAVTADWNVHESRFTNCDFSRSRGEFCFGSGREMSEYVDCRFDHSRISAVTAGRARFIRCSFRDVLITKWLSSEVEILDCTFSGKIREMSFRADVPSEDQALLGRARNRFERNDLSRAELKGVAFSGGVDLQNQILPTGDGYVLVERADVVLPAVFTEVSGWPDSAVKKAVMTPLTVQLKWYVGYGQRQVLFSPLDWISRDGTKEQAYKALLPLLHKHAIRASSE